MMTMTCLIGLWVWVSGRFSGSAASTGPSVNCPSAKVLSPRQQLCSKRVRKRDSRLSRIIKASFVGLVGRLGRSYGVGRLDTDAAHHAAVLVLEQMAVVDEGADDVGIAKIHEQPHARILQ